MKRRCGYRGEKLRSTERRALARMAREAMAGERCAICGGPISWRLPVTDAFAAWQCRDCGSIFEFDEQIVS